MAKNEHKVIGLDIGSAKTTVCVGSTDAQGRIEIHSASMVKTRGVERGVITDLGEVAGCIEEVVKKAENKLHSFQGSKYSRIKNTRINSVFATISGEHILGNNTKAVLNLSNRPVEIGRKDTQRAIDSAKYLSASVDRDVLHALAQEFIVDGYKRIKNPMGIFGTRLGVNLHIISAGASYVKDVVTVINRAGLDVEGVAYSGFATSLSTLTEQEKQAGVILLEMGAGCVNILFFKEGNLQYTGVIPVGGYDITREIARKLNIDLPQAEELKLQYRNAFSNYGDNESTSGEKIIIKKDASNYESINRKQMENIIDKKLDEQLLLIKKDLELAGIISRVKRGVVVCGGMSFMDGIIEKMEKTLGLKVSMGIMRGFVSSSSSLISNIFYSTGIGLIMHALGQKNTDNKKAFATYDIRSKIIAKIREVYEEYF
ncbi:MAG: cell division protein FtsA [Candidatus Omnitrophica bacterium]|nr:cell division protein FtsA [Candidatus Omnitrophota bacterium]